MGRRQLHRAETLGVVVTTIQAPTRSLGKLAERVGAAGGALFVVGDAKTPTDFSLADAEYLSLETQRSGGSRLAAELPTGHYARKNLGYLAAIRLGATRIYETDDDNEPLASWAVRGEKVPALAVRGKGWINAYRHFTPEPIWPRGLPLDSVLNEGSFPKTQGEALGTVRAPVQQGLANGEPDVDAVWRLVMGREVCFESRESLLLRPGAWCPFNSQSTWWFPVAYPLLYLPSFCSFRMTDIWRSFVAQRCLWELGLGVVFHAAEAFQTRNTHDLMRDFEQEVPGYLGNQRLTEVLADTRLWGGEDMVGANLVRCYRALIGAGFFPESEAALVELWLEEGLGWRLGK